MVLLFRFRRYKSHRRSSDRLADGSSIVGVVLASCAVNWSASLVTRAPTWALRQTAWAQGRNVVESLRHRGSARSSFCLGI